MADRLAGIINDEEDETQVSHNPSMPESSGNLVDDILNGTYDDGTGAADDLLADGLEETEHLI